MGVAGQSRFSTARPQGVNGQLQLLRFLATSAYSLPFRLGWVCITFEQADLTIKLPDGHEFKFPNRLNMEAINYMAADGDFKIKCVSFE
ncbi:Galectin-1 [Microtus ochrogaster]|uniref:Galectin n=1 Tax=Microtus ochrogaster TaxID=79684 RepID=A0A8J6GZG4_MICOH|nr:Galectin-1 [Microtus ochrogaster]